MIVNLGPLEKLGTETLRNLADGFHRAAGEPMRGAEEPQFISACDFGHVYAVAGVWEALGLSRVLRGSGLDGETTFGAAEMVKLLVVNRICDPCSKLALLEWLDSVWFPGLEERRPSYHHLLRAMDRLLLVKEKAEPALARRFHSGKRQEGDLVFYDITSTWFEGDRSVEDEDIRRFGYSRDGRFYKRQITIGVVMSAEGIPLCHHVFAGNRVDKTTVVEVVKDLKTRFKLRRVIFVGDRGMLSDENLEALLVERFGFIVAHPLRRDKTAHEVIENLAGQIDPQTSDEQFLQEERAGVRFVLAYSPLIAEDVSAGRDRRLTEADVLIKEWLSRLKNPLPHGRKPTAQGTYDRIRDYLRDKGLLSFYRLRIEGGQVTAVADKRVRSWEERIDGMLLLETTDLDAPAPEIVRRYKELAEIERGWRALKSALDLRPVYHWTEERIRAHVFVCVLALQIERWMRRRLDETSVPAAIRQLRRIKMGEIVLGERKTLGPTRPTPEQRELLRKLGVAAIPGRGDAHVV